MKLNIIVFVLNLKKMRKIKPFFIFNFALCFICFFGCAMAPSYKEKNEKIESEQVTVQTEYKTPVQEENPQKLPAPKKFPNCFNSNLTDEEKALLEKGEILVRDADVIENICFEKDNEFVHQIFEKITELIIYYHIQH